jgi:catalase
LPDTVQASPENPKLSGPDLSLRLALIGAILLAIFLLFAYAGAWLTPRKLTPAAIVIRFQQLDGIHSGFRRNHAEGLGISGSFVSNGNAAAICKATIFQPGTSTVIGRFSLPGGKPYVIGSGGTPRGLGLRLAPAHGEEWRTAMLDLPVFPVATPKAFFDQLLAMAPDKSTGKPDMEKVKAFFTTYPDAARAHAIIQDRKLTSGFADSTYHSLNTFRLINADGASVYVRWSFEPEPPAAAPAAPASSPSTPEDKNPIFDALIAAVHAHPLQWHLIFTIAQPGDPLNNATVPWPADRQRIDAGTLTIDSVESEATSPARDLNFDPLILPDGMAPSDDPLLSARSAIYSQSFTRREGEPKLPSAISPAEAGK